MRLYIVRHADPDYDNDTLTNDGRREAEALARRFAACGLDKIYSSPLGRAVETAKYTADVLNLECNVENWTKELWPELAFDNPDGEKTFAIHVHGEIYRNEKNINLHDKWYCCEQLKGIAAKETYDKLIHDSDEFLLRHGYERVAGRYRIVSRNELKIGIFCHGGFALTWLAHLLEIPVHLMWSGFWLPTTSVTTILFDERSREWAVPRCIQLGDTSHLYESGLPVRPRGIVANYY